MEEKEEETLDELSLDALMDEEEIKEEKTVQQKPAIDSLFSYTDEGQQYIIRFDDLFDKPKLSVYNEFQMAAKRNFRLSIGDIYTTYNEIFQEDGKFKSDMSIVMLHILNTQRKIVTKSPLPISDFLKLIDEIVESGDGILLKTIDKVVEDAYQLTLDADTKKMKEKKTKAVNVQTFISDDYGKALIKIAYLERIFIPIVSQYLFYNKSSFPSKTSVVNTKENLEELVYDEINQTIFNYLFNLIAKENSENIKNKIYKMIVARITRTLFSAKKYWTVANDLAITPESATLDIYSKIMVNSIPKIMVSKDSNVVNFLSVIITNQVNFLFSNKFETHYQTLNPSIKNTRALFESNDEDMSEIEKLEIRMGRKNEGSLVIQEVMISEVVEMLPEYMEVSVTKEEIINTLQYVHINPTQEKIVGMLTYKYFQSTDAIKMLDVHQYAKVLICCSKYLEKLKFTILPKLLISRCIKQRERTGITGIKIKEKIENSKKYKNLFETKFKNFKNEVSKPIQALIATIYSSSFVDLAGNDVVDTSTKIGNIAEELIELAYFV